MTSKMQDDIAAIEKAMAAYVPLAGCEGAAFDVPGVYPRFSAARDRWMIACAPERIRRLLDERARALSLLKDCEPCLDDIQDEGLLSQIEAFIKESGCE